MKKIFTLCFIITLVIYTQAQIPQLWGTTTSAGACGQGTIFTLRADNTNFAVGHNFGAIDNPSFPQSNLCKASNGLLYGLSSGVNGSLTFVDSGYLFSFNPATRVYSILFKFNIATGAFPYGSLVQANNGLLYGMTEGGGATGNGVIFSFDPVSDAYTDLFDFPSLGEPYGSLVQASNGKLYGITSFGGTHSGGNIFSFDPISNNYKSLYSFGSGTMPEGSLLQASNGLLYGMTQFGGAGNGNLFSIDTSGNYADLFDFTGTTGAYPGANPYGTLIQATGGDLYGLTSNGGADNMGVLFSFATGPSTYTDLVDFDNNNLHPGAHPFGDLMQATAGNLYGMTSSGGMNGNGALFSFVPGSSTYTDLFDFSAGNDGTINGGANPYGGLVQVNSDSLYGMTFNGGTDAKGNLFSFNPVTYNYIDMVDFGSTTQAGFPWGTVMRANNGLLYGMTNSGGTGTDQFGGLGGDGAVYSFNPATSAYNELYDFESDGSPYGNLMQASNGLLYGMTFADGLYGRGTIYSIDPVSGAYTDVFDFSNTDGNGVFPYGTLIQAKNGLLYGMTSTGGGVNNNGWGEIFSFSLSSGLVKPLYNFTGGTDGAFPYIGASLVQASNGRLYGMAGLGGAGSTPGCACGYGVIFSIDTLGQHYKVLWSFDGTTGGNPAESLIQASNGLLYGMTNGNNSGTNGVLFSVDTQGNYHHLVDFNSSTGDNPYSINGTLYQASDGNLYGGTTNGGTYSSGTIFQYNYNDSTYTVIRNLNTSDGTRPFASLIEWSPAAATIVTSGTADSPFCAGEGVSVQFTITGVYNTGNVFTAQLSDANGSFSNPLSIGSVTSVNPGTINATIPSYTPAGTAYRIRVVSSNPVVTGTDNGSNIIISVLASPLLSANDSLICASDSALIYVSGTYSSYSWNDGDTTNYTYARAAGPYWVTVTNVYGCTAVSDHQEISTYPAPSASIEVHGDTLTSFGAISYQWYLNGSPINNATLSIYIAVEQGSYTVAATDTNGCTATSSAVDFTAINELAKNAGLSLFPNPSTNYWRLTVDDNLIGSLLEIFDDNGRIIFQSEIAAANSEISCCPLPGIYILRVSTSNTSIIRKLVKM